jgi:glycosyltransferase involved in cell wall biosynthesis
MQQNFTTKISIIIPVYNEAESLPELNETLLNVLSVLPLNYEILYIDDGSTDGSFEVLKELKRSNNKIKIIKFRKNFGQTAAIDAGFKKARGELILTMDADLQNDPADIPKLLEKINNGYDVICGWRKNRQDPFSKKIISRGANLLRKIILCDKIHDAGCTLKIYRKTCLQNLNLYGEMHRFIPSILEWRGFKISEVIVNHCPRKYGQTKYSLIRTIRGLLDMIVVKFWMRYSVKPMHIFGGLGIICEFLGLISLAYLFYIKIFLKRGISDRPLLILAVLLIILGGQFVVFGLISDILIKIYYKEDHYYEIESQEE